MELELGLKITHNRDDITSHANLRIAKDYNGPLFLSRETDAMFLLIAYLKGFRRQDIEIDINKEGTRISINGKRAVQEMVLSGWIMHKKDVQLRAFRKVFRIPDGIVLDRIKAKFNDQESSLTIVMPKLVKRMLGIEIQEVKEPEDLDIRGQKELDELPEEHREPDKKKMDEIEEVLQKEIERREPEVSQVPRDKFSTEENVEEAAKEAVEPKIDRTEESDRVLEKVETMKEVAEVLPDNSKGTMLQEKPEGIPERLVENEGDETEFKKMQGRVEVETEPERSANMAEAETEPGRSADMKMQEKAETEVDKGSEEIPPDEKAGLPAAMEPEGVKPEKKKDQTDERNPIPVEEAPREMSPDLKEKKKKHEIPETEIVEEEKQGNVEKSPELTEAEMIQQQQEPNQPNQSEKEQATEEAVQESQKPEPERNIQEPKNPEPHQQQDQVEPEQTAEQLKKDENNGQEESHSSTKAETIEEANDGVKLPGKEKIEKHESVEIEKQKELNEQASKTKNPAISKGFKLHSPFVVAGSAILVSLIVLFFNLIRSKRR